MGGCEAQCFHEQRGSSAGVPLWDWMQPIPHPQLLSTTCSQGRTRTTIVSRPDKRQQWGVRGSFQLPALLLHTWELVTVWVRISLFQALGDFTDVLEHMNVLSSSCHRRHTATKGQLELQNPSDLRWIYFANLKYLPSSWTIWCIFKLSINELIFRSRDPISHLPLYSANSTCSTRCLYYLLLHPW